MMSIALIYYHLICTMEEYRIIPHYTLDFEGIMGYNSA